MNEILDIVGVVDEKYIIITLGCVILGYLVTTTPYINKYKDSIPLLVTAVGMLLGMVLYGTNVESAIYGALAGIVSSGLYELFGKSVRNLGSKLEEKGVDVTKSGDEG